ncbi:MAG: septation regulator SpoVG [Bacillota bacterium]|nr:septation regulator SpoVG [Bacillota bacterium]
MEVTDIRFRRSNRNGRVLALASLTFDDCFVVHDVRIIDGAHGPFISMPARRTAAGDYLDTAHPITAEYRQTIQEIVLEAYEDWRAQQVPGEGKATS